MKIHYASIALIAGVSVAFSSCVAPSAGYVSYSAPRGISTGVAWTNASYDASGFPIFGYSYGRPVYGYTPSGAAIFTIAALTALSYVPHWSPASWYRGHYRYPAGIHRVIQPPHYPAGHAPHVRPPAGAHIGPGMPKPMAPRPGSIPPRQQWHRPGSNVAPQRPGWSQPGSYYMQNPGSIVHHSHSGNSMAHNAMLHRPNHGHMGNMPQAGMGGAANHGGHATLPAPGNGRPIAAAGSFTGNMKPAPHAPGGFNGGQHGGRR